MKPILFNTDMVQAILEGRKTVTRRIVKPQNAVDFDHIVPLKPPYNDGDILYVRETWMQFDKDHIIDGVKYAYKADCSGESERIRYEYGYRWKPSIHMPKEAARIFLRVTDVRVERLQSMDEIDAVKEGTKGCPYGHTVYFPEGSMEACFYVPNECFSYDYDYCNHSYPEIFGHDIWDKTIKHDDLEKYGWEANPWVWVIEFERINREEAIK